MSYCLALLYGLINEPKKVCSTKFLITVCRRIIYEVLCTTLSFINKPHLSIWILHTLLCFHHTLEVAQKEYVSVGYQLYSKEARLAGTCSRTDSPRRQ